MVPFLYFHTTKTARFSLLGRFASFVVALEKWKGEDTERSSSRTYEKSEDRDIDKPSRGEKEEKRKEKMLGTACGVVSTSSYSNQRPLLSLFFLFFLSLRCHLRQQREGKKCFISSLPIYICFVKKEDGLQQTRKDRRLLSNR